MTATPDATTSSTRASTTRFAGDFGGSFACTSAFLDFNMVGAAVFALVPTDFGCAFGAFFED